ncbi:Streptothricin hydrolase [Planococcus massiliensis]|uniref:Streptothricin hydrolase n=1 Tax=Planococcus massiliensis TaxID=1499687 RepID=A0A098EJ66_9BACL|nr:cysteine hydrolase family protein [Planococcus massiliensis]CEG21346.1 Streptothricin hydrolase [Planococcus massiliensis]
MDKEKTALLLVDVQQAFDDESWGERNNPEAETKMAEILAAWRNNEGLVLHVQHRSDNPESLFYPHKESFEIKEELQPAGKETIITKKVNSAFIGTNLEEILRMNGVTTVVIVGLTTPHCISTTARMSGNLGFSTYVVSDATAAYELHDPNGKRIDPETIHSVSLATLHGEFAHVVTTAELMHEFISRPSRIEKGK